MHRRRFRHLRTALFLLVLTFLFARCSAGPTEPILPPSFESRAMALSAVDCDTAEDIGAAIDLLEETRVLNHGRATALRTRLVQAMRHDAAGRSAQAAAAYVTTPVAPGINLPTLDYVNTFIPRRNGKNYNPHVTIGVGTIPFVETMKTAPFQQFKFKVAGAAVYHLGNFGTAAKELWVWQPTVDTKSTRSGRDNLAK